MGHMNRTGFGGSWDTGLWLIAIFKLVKGLLLVAFGTGALLSLHQDVAGIVGRWIYLLRVDPDNRYIHALLEKLIVINPRKLEEISAGTFIYATLVWVEGVGLLLRKHWAEYFTAVMTASFIPLEVYELARRLNGRKIILIAINVMIVWYLVDRVKRRRGIEASSGQDGYKA